MDWVHLQQDLSWSLQLCPDLFQPIGSPETLNVYERDLTTNIQQVVDRHVQFKQICEFSKSWCTDEIRELRQRQNRLRRRWARTGHEEDRITFLQGRRQLRNAIIEAKKKAWRDFCSETGRDDHWRIYWWVVRPQGPAQVEDLDDGNDRITSDEGKATKLAATFFPSLPAGASAHHTRITKKWSNEKGTSHCEVPPIRETELLRTVQRMRRTAAPGLDEISGTLLKHCIFILLPFLLQLFNASLSLG